MIDIMPKGMDDDAFQEEEQRINKAMLEADEAIQQKWQELNAQWERDNGF